MFCRLSRIITALHTRYVVIFEQHRMFIVTSDCDIVLQPKNLTRFLKILLTFTDISLKQEWIPSQGTICKKVSVLLPVCACDGRRLGQRRNCGSRARRLESTCSWRLVASRSLEENWWSDVNTHRGQTAIGFTPTRSLSRDDGVVPI